VSHADGIGQRKAEHLEICTLPERYEVENGSTMLNQVRFVHRALPEISASEIDPSIDFLGYRVSLPCFISSMTGGSAEGYRANKDLARIAQEARLPVGMGSIRILFRKPEVIDHFRLKEIAPDVPVFANIGGVQLPQSENTRLIELVKELGVDAIAVHLNPGQELAQPEGDRDFRGVLDGVRRLCEESPVPIIVKETGFGIAPDEVKLLLDAGARYVNVAGSGGTNWVTVEGYRLSDEQRAVTDEFAGWGMPTGVLVAAARDTGAVLASGGLRSGMDVAKAVALGAVSAGLALPFIRAVTAGGVETGLAFARQLETVIRNVMLLTGSRTVEELRSARILTTPAFDAMVTRLREQTGV
jgi:isopentenyl-diphosphate delta-isomerase type 2